MGAHGPCTLTLAAAILIAASSVQLAIANYATESPEVNRGGREHRFQRWLQEFSEKQQLDINRKPMDAYIASLSSKPHSGGASTKGKSQGIVYPSGGAKQLINTYVSISVLRHHHKCTLPIEVVYNGEEEVPAKIVDMFRRDLSDVTFIDATKVALPKHHQYYKGKLEGFAIKGMALYAASFDEVLMIDSDNMPLADPTSLFSDASFQATGNMLWPDLATNTGPAISPHAYKLLDLRNPWITQTTYRSTESGQVLLNKKMHPEVMEYLLFLNLHHHIFYTKMHGDTATYQLAFEMAGKCQLFNQVLWSPRMALHRAIPRELDMVHPLVGIIQHDPQGEPTFLHRVTTGAKYDHTKAEYLHVAYVTTPIRAELFFGSTWGITEPFGYLHQYRTDLVDIETAGKDCRHNMQLCEEMTHNKGLTAMPVDWFPTVEEALRKCDTYFEGGKPTVLQADTNSLA